MSDPERERAITALAHLLRDHDVAEPDALALEVIAVLTTRGWRLTNAQPAPAGVTAAPPTEEFLAARAAIQRHGDHGPEVTCRPAGHGLCEPAPAGAQLVRARDLPGMEESRG